MKVNSKTRGHGRSNDRTTGFTLIELMIVVAIIGILSALAIPSFNRYILKTKVAEGPVLLGAIAAHQEAYYSEFGQYFDGPTAGAGTTAYPGSTGWAPATCTPIASIMRGQLQAWPAAAPGFDGLGFRPSGPVRMGLITIAGRPGTEPGGYTPDFWFVAAAVADIDDDGSYLFMELGSQLTHVSAIAGDGDSGNID